jgi:hypothetical protein
MTPELLAEIALRARYERVARHGSTITVRDPDTTVDEVADLLDLVLDGLVPGASWSVTSLGGDAYAIDWRAA